MEEQAKCFLMKFVEEFPAALEEDAPLPVSALSCKVSEEELQGEMLEMGLRLLATRYDSMGGKINDVTHQLFNTGYVPPL